MQVCPAAWGAQSPSHHSLTSPGPGSLRGAIQAERAPQQWGGPPNCTAITTRWCRSPHFWQVTGPFSPKPSPHTGTSMAVQGCSDGPRHLQGRLLEHTTGTTTVLLAWCLAAGTWQPPEAPASHPGLLVFTHWDLRKLGEIVSSSKQFDQEMCMVELGTEIHISTPSFTINESWILPFNQQSVSTERSTAPLPAKLQSQKVPKPQLLTRTLFWSAPSPGALVLIYQVWSQSPQHLQQEYQMGSPMLTRGIISHLVAWCKQGIPGIAGLWGQQCFGESPSQQTHRKVSLAFTSKRPPSITAGAGKGGAA